MKFLFAGATRFVDVTMKISKKTVNVVVVYISPEHWRKEVADHGWSHGFWRDKDSTCVRLLGFEVRTYTLPRGWDLFC